MWKVWVEVKGRLDSGFMIYEGGNGKAAMSTFINLEIWIKEQKLKLVPFVSTPKD